VQAIKPETEVYNKKIKRKQVIGTPDGGFLYMRGVGSNSGNLVIIRANYTYIRVHGTKHSKRGMPPGWGQGRSKN